MAQFSERLNLGQPVDRILYCTAMVSGTSDNPDKAHRQYAYHQALRIACPSVEIILGTFSKHDNLRPLAGCRSAPPCAIQVVDRNEKGSDVNLASRLVHDGHCARFDRAIVVSGDSDLVEPVRIVVSEIGKTVWVRNPRAAASKELRSVASDYSRILPAVLAKSQLPEEVSDGSRIIRKPQAWSQPRLPRTKRNLFQGDCPQPGCFKTIKTFRLEATGSPAPVDRTD